MSFYHGFRKSRVKRDRPVQGPVIDGKFAGAPTTWPPHRPTSERKYESVKKSGLSGLSVKLWVPTAEDVLQIVVKDFGPCL